MTDTQEYPPIPKTKTEPWGHQIDAYYKTKNLASVLFYMGMGTGKSRCVIDQIANSRDMKKIIIVCPLAVINAWGLQFKTHFPGKYVFTKLNHGSTKRNYDAMIHERMVHGKAGNKYPLIFCINYESIWRGAFGKHLLNHEWDMVVADECFTAGTSVATPRGRVPIEKLKIGDEVFSYDFLLSKVIKDKVVDTFCRRTTTPLLKWMDTFVTANHPVWTEGEGFQPADKILINFSSQFQQGLRLFASLRVRPFDFKELAARDVILNEKGTVVYNIETETHNYFANGLLVHNCQKIKAPGSKVSRFMAKLGKRTTRRFGLSGTPLANSPMDAYAEFRFLNPNIFGTSFVRFRSKFAVMGGYGGYQVIGYRNKDEFTERFHSITYHVDSSVLDLPEALHVEIPIVLGDDKMSKYTKQVYYGLEREFVAGIRGGVVTVSNALVKLLRLQQVTSGFITPDGPDAQVERLNSFKEDALIELLSSVGDEPVVVFCRFVEDLKSVHRAAEKIKMGSLELSGKHKELEQWQAGEGQVLAVQISSGAEGISLVRSKYAIYYSLGFSLSQYEQSLARLNRPGQTRPVTYYHLTIKNTIDDKLYKALSQKKKVIEELVLNYNRYTEKERQADAQYVENKKAVVKKTKVRMKQVEDSSIRKSVIYQNKMVAWERERLRRALKRKEFGDAGRDYQKLFSYGSGEEETGTGSEGPEEQVGETDAAGRGRTS